jgi:putative glutamine amidotransferase
MTTSRPRIAIPEPTSNDPAYNQRGLPQYIRSLESAGAVAVPISLSEPPEKQQTLLNSCSGILLPGSPADLDPARYGAAQHPETAAKDELREATDTLLLRDAFTEGKPVLGICYGLQSLNVWRGGSLEQHVPGARLPGVVNHQPGRTVERAHPISVNPTSRLAAIIAERSNSNGEDQEFVNSSHHQAVREPGHSLRVVATSPVDGVIEAVEGLDPEQFVLGVQWHPERTYESSETSRAIFRAFVQAAESWKL